MPSYSAGHHKAQMTLVEDIDIATWGADVCCAHCLALAKCSVWQSIYMENHSWARVGMPRSEAMSMETALWSIMLK